MTLIDPTPSLTNPHLSPETRDVLCESFVKTKFWPIFKRDICATWEAIADDCYNLCESNEDALEFCLDADRIIVYGNAHGTAQESAAFFRKMYAVATYPHALRFLAGKITLL